tara:strand:- start:27053 stop:27442 length:390 start_codon:yes stop_codon:yes gene_type:complete
MMRYYDPSIGRYITSDPLGLSGGVNTYGYALQNPVGNIDPNGEATIVSFILIVGGVILTFNIVDDIICNCQEKYPDYRTLLSEDRNKFFQCLTSIGPFLNLVSFFSDPVRGSATEIGGAIGTANCDSCE